MAKMMKLSVKHS